MNQKKKINFSIERGLNKTPVDPSSLQQKPEKPETNNLGKQLTSINITEKEETPVIPLQRVNTEFNEKSYLTVMPIDKDNVTPSNLEELFQTTFKIVRPDIVKKLQNIPYRSITVGIELFSDTQFNSSLAYAETKKERNAETDLPRQVDNHIGNIANFDTINSFDLETIKKFNSLIKIVFTCFGKKFTELSKEKIDSVKSNDFSILEEHQSISILFNGNTYSIDVVLSKYIQYLLKTFEIEEVNKRIKELCITFPNDFTSVQRLTLTEILTRLSIKKYTFVTKNVALAGPTLLQFKDDPAKTLLIDFSSGKKYLKNTLHIYT